MSLMWGIPGYIINVAIEAYILVGYWNLEDPTIICVIVDLAHYVVIFCLLLGIVILYPNDNANQRLQWIEIFPTMGYIASIFIVVLQKSDQENIIAIINFGLATIRYFFVWYGARQKKRFIALSATE